MASRHFLQNKKVLITCGPTWVPIDSMRVIGNRSTGALGRIAAEHAAAAGANVTVLQGPGSVAIQKTARIRVIPFTFFDELKALLAAELTKKYAVVIHAAAVSDYRLEKPYRTKIDSHKKTLTLRLVQTEKLIDRIKRIDPAVTLVGFKLASRINEREAAAHARALYTSARCDIVVANALTPRGYTGYVVDAKSGTIISTARSRKDVVKKIITTINHGMK